MTTPKKTPKKRPAPTPRTDPYDDFSDIGNDEHDDDGMAIVKVDGMAALVPLAIRRLEPSSMRHMAKLQNVVRRRQALGELVDELVADARSQGVSWSSVGWCVGTTGDAARKRWGTDQP
jgi:hypothetical protein